MRSFVPESVFSASAHKVWGVGALCHAIADALDARFNPVSVRGEISGFSRAASGHCYFSLKDDSGQMRCAMFRRAAGLLDFSVRDGDLVEVRGRLGVYEARGDLQLIVETMSQAGKGSWFEDFLRSKARLEAQGLFDSARKRPVRQMPRGVGLVTSLGAAALHDVVTALQRRMPHVQVVISPALVQGPAAPAALSRALEALYPFCGPQAGSPVDYPVLDTILLVRGGGAMEDLWAFNDEGLAHVMARSPVPIISGVGHETDFTIADFVADLRAPTPTAAAEMAGQDRGACQTQLSALGQRFRDAATRQLDRQEQWLDLAVSRLGRPSARLASQKAQLAATGQQLKFAATAIVRQSQLSLQRSALGLEVARNGYLQDCARRIDRDAVRLGLLDPARVLARGYAWISTLQGETITRISQVEDGQRLRATLSDGRVELLVIKPS